MDYNPLQIDSDGDSIGDACDYPDLVLEVEYSNSTQNQAGNEIELSWLVDATLKNIGTETIDAGTELVVIWEQDSLIEGEESQQQTEGETDLGNLKGAVITQNDSDDETQVMYIGAKQLSDDDSSPIAAATNTVFEYQDKRTEIIELHFDLSPNKAMSLTDQQFEVTVGANDCAEVTHIVDVDRANQIQEIDGNEDNEVSLTGYSFWGCGGEMDTDIIDSVIGGLIGPDINDGWQNLDNLVTEAALDKIIQTIGPEGSVIEIPHEHITVEFPAGSVVGQVDVEVAQIASEMIKDFTPVGDICVITVPNMVIFSEPVTVILGYNENQLPSGVTEQELTLFTSGGNMWKPIRSNVDTEANTVSASVTHFSKFVIGSIKEFKMARNLLQYRKGRALDSEGASQANKNALIKRKTLESKKSRPVDFQIANSQPG